MLDALFQTWMQDTAKRKWLLSYIPLIIAFALMIFIAWQIANLYWFTKDPLADLNLAPIQERQTQVEQQATRTVDIQALKNSDLFGKYQEVDSNPEPQPVEEAPETNLQLTLNGTLVSTKSEDSLAIIKKDNEEKVYKVGDELLSNVSVDSIYAAEVIINNRGKKEVLKLPKEEQNASRSPTRQPNRQVSRQANKLANQLKQDALKNPAKLTDILRLKKGKLSSGIQGCCRTKSLSIIPNTQ